MRSRRALVLVAAFVPACVFDNGPTDLFDDRPFVQGYWDVDAFVQSTSCDFVGDERFVARVVQNRDILQIVIDVSGFGDVRYDGFLDRDGDFSASHTTIFPEDGLRDDSVVEGEFRFDGRSLFATEEEVVTDLLTGRRCGIVWSWRGSRR